MAKRLVLGSIVALGVTVVVLLSQAPVVAFWSRPHALEPVQKPAEPDVNEGPRFDPPGVETATIDQIVMEPNGDVRIVQLVLDVSSLRERYVDYHRRIAEKLTAKQLAEKCNSLRKEANGITAEEQIEQIRRQLSELKRKNPGNKGVSSRLERAIDALGSRE